jgi:diguanylate cyclase (GGDEF)-like protein/PAS domain S-box-containing protein
VRVRAQRADVHDMTELMSDGRDTSVRGFARFGASMRRNALLVVALGAVIAALTATVVVVRTGASSKDRLRQAQIALVQEPAALFATVHSPLALLAGQVAEPSEFPLSTSLRDRLKALAVTTDRLWSTPLTRKVSEEARQVGSSTAQLMRFVAEHRLARANVISSRVITPLALALGTNMVAAEQELNREITHDDQTSWTLTLAVAGFAGAVLLALVIAIALGRGRRERTRIERGRVEIESRAVRESFQQLKALVEHGSDIITVVRTDASVVYQVGPVEAILGYAAAMPAATKLTDWVATDDRHELVALCRTRETARHELRMLHSDGTNVTCEASATSLLDHPVWGDVVVVNMWDVTGRKVLEERLRHQAFHDQLTELPNRALVLDCAARMLARAKRQSTSVVALYIDLDGFKKVNDDFGHAVGDELLQIVGARLLGTTRKSDLVGRLGGDEFIMLLDGFTLDSGPEMVAERLLAVLREPVILASADGSSVCINASVGIAVALGGTADELLRDADLALYEAKHAGKNRYAVSKPPPEPGGAAVAYVALDPLAADEAVRQTVSQLT